MENHRFEIGLAAILFACVAAVWYWQNPGVFSRRASEAEIERYLAAVDKPRMPVEEKAEALKRLRHWLGSDDGRPVYVLNLMR
jgi:hypothetical protein